MHASRQSTLAKVIIGVGGGLFVLAVLSAIGAVAYFGAKADRAPERLTVPGTWSRDGCHVAVDPSVSRDTLTVLITVATTNRDRRIAYLGWAANPRWVTLTDDRGRRLPAKDTDVVLPGIGPGLLERDRGCVDAIRFDLPDPSAKFLDLDLDAAAVGQRGTIGFRIPASALKSP